ncbi:MAG: cytochrome b/b6 domain-containing protein [Lysobacterales bacterium]
MQKIYVHPLPVRIWHWINAAAILLLIFTGLQIRYAGTIDLMSFRNAVVLHNWLGFLLGANFLLWLFYYLFSDNIRIYQPELRPSRYFPAMFKQIYFYSYGILRGEPNPHRVSKAQKFNPMQAMTYQIVMLLMLPVQFYTGLLLWDASRFANQIDLLGGVRVVSTAHVLLSIAFLGFLLSHLYLITLGHTAGAHTKAMITGYEEVEDEAAASPSAKAPESPAKS